MRDKMELTFELLESSTVSVCSYRSPRVDRETLTDDIESNEGPRMSTNDGRLVSNFAVAALKGEPIEIYGDGQFTRSLMVCSPIEILL